MTESAQKESGHPALAAKADTEPTATTGPAGTESVTKTVRPEFVDLAAATTVEGVRYDEAGRLVDTEGKRVGLTADYGDADVGWTAQASAAGAPIPSIHATKPDQTFHPDELPDPINAIRAGLLPQDVTGLNIDPDKFKDLKPLDV